MALEEEIQQYNFKSERYKALINMVYTGNWLNNHMGRLFKKYDLSSQQFNVLRILRGRYPEATTVKLVQQRMLDRTSNASRLIDKLVQKNFIIRKECQDDRRQVDIFITDQGNKLLDNLDPVLEKFVDETININEKAASELNAILDEMRRKI